MGNSEPPKSTTDLETEIASLKARLAATGSASSSNSTNSSLHALLLLSDSALPLGSFAFSSGLESYLAHHSQSSRPNSNAGTNLHLLHSFLRLSLSSLASTSLPYVVEAYRHPDRIEELDNDFDASVACNVAKRASIAQGRGLLAVWERSLSPHFTPPCSESNDAAKREAAEALTAFSSALKATSSTPKGSTTNAVRPNSSTNPHPASSPAADVDRNDDLPILPPPSAHYAPLWGLLTRLLGLGMRESLFLFLFSHLRTVVSAAVRASVLGPYQAQGLLGSVWARELVEEKLEDWWDGHESEEGARSREDVGIGTEAAGQSVPVMDLWVGRHEMLYSRIFNS